MALSTKQSFLAGVGAALVVFFVIGFFVLLVMMLSGKSWGEKSAVNDGVPPIAGDLPPVEIVVDPVTDQDWIRGNPDADITIVEYSDIECPYCKTFHPEISQAIDEYSDDVRWVYRHFPLTSIHPKAPKEAEAVECAGELGGNDGFWAYLDRMFEITPANNGFNLAELPDVAEYIGLDRAAFTECLDSGKYADKIRQQTDSAIAAGAQGTPYSVIITPDGETIPVNGAVQYAQLKSFFDSVLAN
ncbi:MAG: DsbA family protein [bacterium]|nr:DsbA family protein [bacterium]